MERCKAEKKEVEKRRAIIKRVKNEGNKERQNEVRKKKKKIVQNMKRVR